MNKIHVAKFLNLDLEVESRSDLAPLAEFLGSKNYVLFSGRVGRYHRLCIEPLIRGTLNGGVKRCTDHFLKLLEGLPPELLGVWNSCQVRVLDFGFDGGAESPPLTVSLTAAQLLRIASLNVSVRITIYSHRAEEPQDEE